MVGRLFTYTRLIWYDAARVNQCGIWIEPEEPHKNDGLRYKGKKEVLTTFSVQKAIKAII
ncbi:MAG: hypothetical protein RXO71_00350 [Nitrososphaeria archaeon]